MPQSRHATSTPTSVGSSTSVPHCSQNTHRDVVAIRESVSHQPQVAHHHRGAEERSGCVARGRALVVHERTCTSFVAPRQFSSDRGHATTTTTITTTCTCGLWSVTVGWVRSVPERVRRFVPRLVLGPGRPMLGCRGDERGIYGPQAGRTASCTSTTLKYYTDLKLTSNTHFYGLFGLPVGNFSDVQIR